MYLDTKLPTDSLYKFICILGLSIFLGGCLLYWNHYRALLESSIEAEGALEALVHELESERGALEKIAKEYEKFFSSIGEYKKDERGALYTPKLEAGRLIVNFRIFVNGLGGWS
jgi:hypothetical protein